MIGRVTLWNECRGFGFVGIGCGIPDFLFTRGGLETEIAVGDKVTFWIVDNPEGGWMADEIARRDGVAKRAQSMRLFVACIPQATADPELRASLATVGPILRMLRAGGSYGFVDYADRADAEDAMAGVKKVIIDGTRLVFRLPRMRLY